MGKFKGKTNFFFYNLIGIIFFFFFKLKLTLLKKKRKKEKDNIFSHFVSLDLKNVDICTGNHLTYSICTENVPCQQVQLFALSVNPHCLIFKT